MTEPTSADLFPENVAPLAARIAKLAPGVGAFETAARLIGGTPGLGWMVEVPAARIADSDLLRALRLARVTSAPDDATLQRLYPGANIPTLHQAERDRLRRQHDRTAAPPGRLGGAQLLRSEADQANRLPHPSERIAAARQIMARVKAEAVEEKARRLAEWRARQGEAAA